MPQRSLEGKVAIVTGASQGIGRASVIEFAREGAKVIAAARSQAGCEETVRLACDAGGEALAVPTDVSVSADVRRMIQAAVDTYGGLDILFNNAGLSIDKPVVELAEEEWDQVIDVNLKGHFLCAKYAIPHMRARGGGVIINMSSVLGMSALPKIAAYCSTKYGILGLTQVLALELARDRIRVNAIAPGSVDTAMLWGSLQGEALEEARALCTEAQPVGYIGTPEQIGRAAVWLARNEVDFMTGATLLIDGGMMAKFPGPM
jgi:NAD(P)-dependent dehydrogenase (short-subunit alcohol dehydrogenase family)